METIWSYGRVWLYWMALKVAGMYDNFWTDTVVAFYGPGGFHEREYASRDEAMQAVKDGLLV